MSNFSSFGGLASMDSNRVPGINGQCRPDQSESHCLNSGERLSEHGDSQQKHACGGCVLDESQGGQGDAFGAEVEKQQGRGRKDPRAQ